MILKILISLQILGSGGGLASCLAIIDGGQPDLSFFYTFSPILHHITSLQIMSYYPTLYYILSYHVKECIIFTLIGIKERNVMISGTKEWSIINLKWHIVMIRFWIITVQISIIIKVYDSKENNRIIPGIYLVYMGFGSDSRFGQEFLVYSHFSRE